MRIFSPMKSEVDLTVGFSCSIVAAGTPVSEEMTPKVSPAFTVQYRFAVVCGFDAVVVVETEASVGGREVRGGGDALDPPPDSIPERISTTAIVTASRNATGAMYRRQSSGRSGTAYQPEAAQISCLSRAASAPAASRKSPPVSRYA